MIDGWWRHEFGGEPTIDDLDDKARRAVLERVDATKRRVDRVVNTVLAIWLIGSVALLGVLATSALPGRGSMVALGWWVLVPVYASGIRANVLRKATRRAVLRQVRRDRLAAITTVLTKR